MDVTVFYNGKSFRIDVSAEVLHEIKSVEARALFVAREISPIVEAALMGEKKK